MVNLILDKIIKEEDPRKKEKYALFAQIFGILTNGLLALIKFIIGATINSISVTADSINNLMDAVTNLILIVFAKLTNKPADAEHPFGHEKFEFIATLIVAILLFYLGWEFIVNAINEIIHPSETHFSVVTTVILTCSIFIKLWQSLLYRKIGKKGGLLDLQALAKDSLSDVAISVSLVISLLITYFTGFEIDGYLGVIIALYILYSGFKIAKEAISKILGEAVDDLEIHDIYAYLKSQPLIIEAHDLVVHKYGNQLMGTIKVDVDSRKSLLDVYNTTADLENEIEARFGFVDFLIRVIPYEYNNPEIKLIRDAVFAVLTPIDGRLHLDDFRLLKQEEETIVKFEVDFPFDFSDKRAKEIIAIVSSVIRNIDKKYQPIIEIGRHYFVSDHNK